MCGSQRFIYKTLVSKLVTAPTKTLGKWSNDLGLNDICWEEIFKRAYSCSIESKLRNFQFKFIHRIVFTNNKLCALGLVDSSLCDFCNYNLDTIIHRFWTCPCSQTIWENLWEWVSTYFELPNITLSLVMLNIDKEDQIPLVIHQCIIITKLYIYACYIGKTKPSWNHLKDKIFRTEETERLIAIKRDLLEKHIEKWHILF